MSDPTERPGGQPPGEATPGDESEDGTPTAEPTAWEDSVAEPPTPDDRDTDAAARELPPLPEEPPVLWGQPTGPDAVTQDEPSPAGDLPPFPPLPPRPEAESPAGDLPPFPPLPPRPEAESPVGDLPFPPLEPRPEAESPVGDLPPFPPLEPRPEATSSATGSTGSGTHAGDDLPVSPPEPTMPEDDIGAAWDEDVTAPDAWAPAPPPSPASSAYGRALPADEVTARLPHDRPRRSRRWVTTLLAFFAGLLGAAVALGIFALIDDEQPEPAANPPTAATAAVPNQEPSATPTPVIVESPVPLDPTASANPAAVARKVTPSIVRVVIGSPDVNDELIEQGSGSGVVLTGDGLIVTNDHVIADSDRVDVVFADGRRYTADVIGTDPLTDLAVLRISASDLTAIEIGSSDALDIGDTAIAAGSPLGLSGGPTITVGVLSAFGREVQTGPDVQNDRLYGMLQTDAPITRGSSGGALVDSEGRLIGITSAVGVSDVGVEGIGFAIPVELVQRITAELIESGSVSHAFLGISGLTALIDEEDGARREAGVQVESVEEGSGAATAGIEPEDIIVSLAGRTVGSFNDLVAQLRRLRVGETVPVEIDRGGEVITLDLTLGERPEEL